MERIIALVSIMIFNIFFIQGCAGSHPDKKEVKIFSEKDFGDMPKISKFQKQIEENIKSKLKDPYSAKIGECSPMPLKASMYNTIPGWTTVCEVNAKNSYGGYVGYKKYNAFIGFSKKTKTHFLVDVSPIREALEKGLIIYGINDK